MFTPFINRNDFASWLVMALPLTGGYAVARIQSRRRTGSRSTRIGPRRKGADPAAALLMMVAGLLASLSRSGVTGAAAALLPFVALSRGRMSRRWIAWMLAGTAAMIVLAAIYAANLGALTAGSRVVSEGLTGRVAIWRQTWPIVRDFWPVGTGVGAYQEVMVLYQTTTSRLFYISHADNEFLQILAEGGLLLGIPAALALAGAVRTIALRLRADHTPLYWIRAGAASGLLAAGVQNLFEMTLRVPANAVLLALLAAIASHDGGSDSRR